MNRITRKYLIGVALFVLLGVTIASVLVAPVRLYHEGFGLLLALTGLTHCALHRQWHQVASYRGISGKIRLVMNSGVTVTLLLALMTGLTGLVVSSVARLHDVVGVIALLGLLAHGARHLCWMAAVSGKLIGLGRQAEPQISSLESLSPFQKENQP